MRKQKFLLFIFALFVLFCSAAVYSDTTSANIQINKDGVPFSFTDFDVEVIETTITKTTLTTNGRGSLFVPISSGNWYLYIGCKKFIFLKFPNYDVFVPTKDYIDSCIYLPLIDPSNGNPYVNNQIITKTIIVTLKE